MRSDRSAGEHALAVAWRLLAVLGGLTITYLVAANLVLGTPLLKSFAPPGDDVNIDYASAYSVWPGRVVVRDLRVKFHDHNVEFSIGVERGTLDVSLHELFLKRFHALRVDADAVTYRMRHKLSAVGMEGPRVAAYPPIPGFADPPLFNDAPSPPIADEDYDLWEVKVENVEARVKEIWVLEYRYRGPGVARGSFRVQPARYYEVKLATLDLDGGKITLGSAAVAERANVHVRVVVDGSDTQRLSGLAPLHKIEADVRGKLEGTDWSYLDAYLGPHAGVAVRGHGDLDLELHWRRGAFAPESRFALRASDADVRGKGFGFRADKALFELGTRATREGVRSHAELALTGVNLSVGAHTSNRFGATFTGDDIAVQMEGPEPPSGALSLHVDRAPALLPLVTPSPFLRGIETELLGLGDLSASARLRGGSKPLLDLRDARSGATRTRGYLLFREDGPSGAFLVRTPSVNLGIRVTNEGTALSPLVSDAWLDEQAAQTRSKPSRTAPAPGEPGRASRSVD